MNEQRIREIAREEIAKDREAAAVTTAEMKRIMREATGLSNEGIS